MENRLFFLRLFILLLALSLIALHAFADPAGTPDINVFQPIVVPGDTNYFGPGNIIRIQWTLRADDVNSLNTFDANIDLNYNHTASGTGGSIVNDLNLFSACDNTDLDAATRSCTYSWTVPTTQDGNYHIDFNAYVICRPAGGCNAGQVVGQVVDVNATTKSNSFKVLAHDINVFQPITVPGDSNYFKGDQSIVIRWDVQARTVDGVTGPFDANIDLNWSSTAGSFTRRIVKDLNLKSACAGDGNLMARRACTYTWIIPSDFNSQADGNYFVDFNAKIYQLRTNDINTVRDFNATMSSRSFVLDNTAPTVSITSDSVSTSAEYILRWNATDATAAIDFNYYTTAVVVDSNTQYLQLSRGTITQVITISSGEKMPVAKTFCVKAQDRADNNSAVACIDVTFKSPTGGLPRGGQRCGDKLCKGTETAATCPADCVAVCGDNACTHTESSETCPRDCAPTCGNKICDAEETELTCPIDCLPSGQEIRNVVLSATITEKPTPADIKAVLSSAGYSLAAIEKATEASAKVSAERSVVVEEVFVSGTTTFETKVAINVSNSSGKPLQNIKIVESIPKSIAQDATVISSDYGFRVLVSDPVLEFTVPLLSAGETAKVEYTVDAEASEDSLKEWFAPFASSFEQASAERACSSDADCADDNACTNDRCVDGVCAFASLPNGTSCGVGKVCSNAVCVDESLAEGIKVAGFDAVTVIVVLVVVLVAAYYAYSRFLKE